MDRREGACVVRLTNGQAKKYVVRWREGRELVYEKKRGDVGQAG